MLAGCLCSTADASVPPPLPSGTSFPVLQIIDGPGIYCAAGFHIRLAQNEFAIERRQAPYGGVAQIELQEGRILASSSSGGEARGKMVSEGNEGSLFKNVQNGNTRYEFSGGAPGVDIFSSPSFGEFREDKKLLDRIIFAAPRYQKVGDEDCLRSRVIESTVIR